MRQAFVYSAMRMLAIFSRLHSRLERRRSVGTTDRPPGRATWKRSRILLASPRTPVRFDQPYARFGLPTSRSDRCRVVVELATIRDLLLPKLVTGQIDVSKLDSTLLVESVRVTPRRFTEAELVERPALELLAELGLGGRRRLRRDAWPGRDARPGLGPRRHPHPPPAGCTAGAEPCGARRRSARRR